MNEPSLAKLWDEAWSTGLWAASWKASVDGLTPQQAAWKPAAARHSIWQIVSHIMYWREVALRRIAGGPGPDEAETARRNFSEPPEVTDAAWRSMREAFERSQRDVSAVLSNPSADVSKIPYVIAHDAYHMGQIHYVRSLQGLKPIE